MTPDLAQRMKAHKSALLAILAGEPWDGDVPQDANEAHWQAISEADRDYLLEGVDVLIHFFLLLHANSRAGSARSNSSVFATSHPQRVMTSTDATFWASSLLARTKGVNISMPDSNSNAAAPRKFSPSDPTIRGMSPGE